MRRRYSKESVEAAPGVAWFDREQWQRLREVAADPERVPVDTEELIAWCKDRARSIDSSARAEFAARQLRKVHLSE